METFDRSQVIEKLREKTGNVSGRKMAPIVGVSVAYMAEVLKGTRYPGPSILAYLGLEQVEREPMYRPRTYKKAASK